MAQTEKLDEFVSWFTKKSQRNLRRYLKREARRRSRRLGKKYLDNPIERVLGGWAS